MCMSETKDDVVVLAEPQPASRLECELRMAVTWKLQPRLSI